MAEVKKVLQRIYEFDLKNCLLNDGDEMIPTEHGNEFVNTFIKRDLDRGVIVTPGGYTRGLVYKSSNDGEFYNNPEWLPETESFLFNIYGLKKGAFYRVTVVSRNTRKFNRLIDVTENRKLEVLNESQELIINADVTEAMTNTNYSGIFRATSIEENIYFSIGKIYISNIMIDEVEISKDSLEENEKKQDFEIDNGKSNIVAYGVFSPDLLNETGRYGELSRITGKGINLYFDKNELRYIIERDNNEDTVGTSFTNANYMVEFNFNKAPYLNQYQITEVSPDVSPNTLKQGFIKFEIIDKDGKPYRYDRHSGRLIFVVKKIL